MIITNNEDLLRVKCSDVLPEEVGQLRDLLEMELRNSERLGRPGVGLAAPQIGIAKKIAIVRINPSLKCDLVNCTISKEYDPIIHKDEGCLSFPGRVENVSRFQEVLITNNLVSPQSFILTGLMAIACQHELDHLNGILLPDRAIPKLGVSKKVGPNEKCPCGSNIKYKKCHGK